MTILHEILAGYSQLLFFPWIYLVLIVFVWAQYSRTQVLERSAFGVKISSTALEWSISIGVGLLVGLVISVLLDLLKIEFSLQDALWVWGTMLILGLIDVRWTCISYAMVPLALAKWVVWVAAVKGVHLPHWLSFTTYIDLHSLLLLVGFAHIVEGILILSLARRNASPVFVQSRRGQIVGAFLLQHFWPIPLVVMSAGSIMMPLPILINWNEMAIEAMPKRIAQRAAPFVMLYGVMVTLATLLLPATFGWLIALSITVGVLHELLSALLRHRSLSGTPLFVRPSRGVRVLTTVAGSPARRLQVMPGETVIKISGMSVNSSYDIHFALDQNPAYAKLEVQDMRGEVRFLGTTVYDDAPHKLGIIAVPDEQARGYAQIYRMRVGRWVWHWWSSFERAHVR